jgi:hypothetical protein
MENDIWFWAYMLTFIYKKLLWIIICVDVKELILTTSLLICFKRWNLNAPAARERANVDYTLLYEVRYS